ncbi:28596_t:CDS:10 [Dentiscutata erythropus]|uniref:Ribonuclease H2 subunit B n=1 Tax=Dentiscutata erythropus TaxID=1348616 RepID=A0A9N9DIQ4_9GLOM|nr:28596_t:CDS:10 [Dentiscutata erythropus]
MFKQRICIKPKCQEGSGNIISITLPRPRTGLPARYVLQDGNLYEALCVDYEQQKSWFVKDTIEKDGSIVFFTQFDPIFLLIPILDNCRKKNSEFQGLFLSFDDILDNPEYPSLTRLSSINNILLYMDWICDSKELLDNKVYRLNDEKVMNWLKKKVTNILPKFDNDKYKSFKKINQQLDDEIVDEEHRHEHRLKYTLEIVMEYLPNYWVEQLKKEYNFEELGTWDNSTVVYMSAISTDNRVKQPVEKDTSSTVKKRKLTVGQASLAKANKKGMKPLTSFFAKSSQTDDKI